MKKKKRIGVVIVSLGYLWSRPYLGTALNWAFEIIYAVDGQSKREVLGIFNMNQKNVIARFFSLKRATNWPIIYDFY